MSNKVLMSVDRDPKGLKKGSNQKKYLYTYSYQEEDEDIEMFEGEYSEFEAAFEQPKGRRNAKKTSMGKKRKQNADLFY